MSKVKLARESESFFIGAMLLDDLLKIVELEESCQLSRWGYDAYLDELARPDALLFVARNYKHESWNDRALTGGADLIGFIAARLYADEMHINNIAVDVSARRLGVGGRLLTHIADIGARRGAQGISLEVRESNITAQKLYQAYNFATVGVRKNYYKNPIENALLMSARLAKNGLIERVV